MKVYIILISLMLLLGGMLFLAAQFIVKRAKRFHIYKDRTLKLVIWRSFLSMLLIYVLIVYLINLNFINYAYSGIFKLFFNLFFIVFLVSMVEIVAIDYLLPDLLPMHKRIITELLILLTLYFLTFLVFRVIIIVLLTG